MRFSTTLSTSDRKSGAAVNSFGGYGVLSSLEKSALGFVNRGKQGIKPDWKAVGNLLTL
jgi:hypothetical protein